MRRWSARFVIVTLFAVAACTNSSPDHTNRATDGIVTPTPNSYITVDLPVPPVGAAWQQPGDLCRLIDAKKAAEILGVSPESIIATHTPGLNPNLERTDNCTYTSQGRTTMVQVLPTDDVRWELLHISALANGWRGYELNGSMDNVSYSDVRAAARQGDRFASASHESQENFEATALVRLAGLAVTVVSS